MIRHTLRCGLLVAMLFASGLTTQAQDTKKDNDAVKPASRPTETWMKRHNSFLERAKKGHVDVLFLGDSITQGWEGKSGMESWKMHFEPLHAANFGIGGDRTQHVLWRITEGKELEGIQPKVIVLMIGTNNTGSNSAEEIADGVSAIVRELNTQRPQAKVLLLGVFPRSAQASDAVRTKIKGINERIAKLDNGKQVKYLDIGSKFLEPDGTLTKEVMPDLLHLSAKGYQIWGEAVAPVVKELLAK